MKKIEIPISHFEQLLSRLNKDQSLERKKRLRYYLVIIHLHTEINTR
jgi:hypothetical protein